MKLLQGICIFIAAISISAQELPKHILGIGAGINHVETAAYGANFKYSFNLKDRLFLSAGIGVYSRGSGSTVQAEKLAGPYSTYITSTGSNNFSLGLKFFFGDGSFRPYAAVEWELASYKDVSITTYDRIDEPSGVRYEQRTTYIEDDSVENTFGWSFGAQYLISNRFALDAMVSYRFNDVFAPAIRLLGGIVYLI